MDDDDFESWYRRERADLVRALWAMSGDRELAADVVDEAFSRAMARWSRVSAMASPGGWVRTVAVNQLRRTLRRRSMEDHVLARRRPDPAPPPTPDVELWAQVAALPRRQREVLALRYLADCTEVEVAATLGISEGAASANLTKARRRLSEVLSEREVNR